MFFPNQVANDKQLATKLQRLVAPVNEAACNCPLGVANKEVGYHTSGSALDYSFSVLKVPFSMAVEVFLGSKSEEKELAARWKTQKETLMQPERKGSSFLENGISADAIVPMSFIETGDALEKDTPKQCKKYFNPMTQSSFDETVSKWTNAIAQLSIKSREIPADAAVELVRKYPQMSFRQQWKFDDWRNDYGFDSTVKQVGNHAMFALKALGLLLVIYIGFKYYKVKQSKSAEAAPITAQMAPVQISD
jgi:hypothetical protein